MLLPTDVAEQPGCDWRIASAVSWKACIWFSKCACGKTDGDDASPYQKFFKNSSKILREDSQTALQNSLAAMGRRGEWPRKRNDWEQLQCQREEKGRWWAGETESPSLQDWGKIQNDKAAQSYTQFGNPILRNSKNLSWCRVSSTEARISCAECRVSSAEWRISSAECRVNSAE